MRIVDEAGELRHNKTVAAQAEDEFRGSQKLAPIMRTRRQPAEDVFGAHDCEGKRSWGPIESSADERTPRPHQSADRRQEIDGIGDVLDHLNASTVSKRLPTSAIDSATVTQ